MGKEEKEDVNPAEKDWERLSCDGDATYEIKKIGILAIMEDLKPLYQAIEDTKKAISEGNRDIAEKLGREMEGDGR